MSPLDCVYTFIVFSLLFLYWYCCVDVDECRQQPCAHNAQCQNTEGSYKCLCKDGFEVDSRNNNICKGRHCENYHDMLADMQTFYCFLNI